MPLTFKEPSWVLLVQREQLPGCRADLGDDELDAPDLALVAQTKLSDQLQLLVQPLLIKGAPGGGERLAAYQLDARHCRGGLAVLSRGLKPNTRCQ